MIAAALIISNTHIADAAPPTKPYVQKIATKTYKNSTFEIFKVCAGSDRLGTSYVLASSKIDAVPIKINSMYENQCRTHSAQFSAKDPANVKTELLSAAQVDAKVKLQNDINKLSAKITQLDMSKSTPGPNSVAGKIASKQVQSEIQHINMLKSELVALKAQLRALPTI